ncbi:hypothetical protein ACPOLB_22285 [Rubrivivax sp. RP6-9]|uniref:hypothetical protein n=1 Tax=Rubrivivax sp. RP6-9 TaxID=3415750 RepID=UPI003CC5E4B9
MPSRPILKSCTTLAALLLALATTAAPAQAARPPAASEASAISMLPVAVSVAAPVLLFSAGAALTVVAVSSVAEGTLWVLERASDGARASVTVSGQVAGGVSVVAGTAVLVTAFSAGWVLSAAGQAIAVVPNSIGQALLHNELVAR